MTYGPVGSLEQPETPNDYAPFVADTIRLWISIEVLESIPDPEFLRFNFGPFEWCTLSLDMS